ncbi:MAG: diguanylate cyclase [Pseudomonadota bacterium]
MKRRNFITALWRGSIRRQLVLGFAVSSLMLMTLFGYLIHAQQRDSHYLLSTERATSLAHALSISSTSWVLANDLAGLQEVVLGFARTSDMHRAFFVSPQGEVLASTSRDEIGYYVTDPVSREMLASTSRDQLVLVDQRNQVVVAHPVIFSGRHLGWVRVEMTRDTVNSNLDELTRTWFALGAIAVLLVSLVAWALAWRLTNGLQHLMGVASAVEHGWSKRRADVGRRDEIGTLARSLDRMLDAIERQKRLVSESEEKYRFLADNITDVIWVLNLDRERWEYMSPSVERLLGYTPSEASTLSLSRMLAEQARDKAQQAIAERRHAFLTGGDSEHVYRDELEQLTRDGSVLWVEITTRYARNEQGDVIVLGVTRDISERKQAEEQIRNLAFYDPLTQLPNRRLLLDRFNLVIAACKRSKRHAALMFIDLDNFKPLNDKQGHDVGDLLLIEVAQRMTDCVREVDTVARFGGDEFVVMLNELSTDREVSMQRASDIAEKIRQALGEPYRLCVAREQGEPLVVEHRCTASLGVVLFDRHCSSSEDLLRLADDAMYQAKEGGRNQVRYLEPRPPAQKRA